MTQWPPSGRQRGLGGEHRPLRPWAIAYCPPGPAHDPGILARSVRAPSRLPSLSAARPAEWPNGNRPNGRWSEAHHGDGRWVMANDPDESRDRRTVRVIGHHHTTLPLVPPLLLGFPHPPRRRPPRRISRFRMLENLIRYSQPGRCARALENLLQNRVAEPSDLTGFHRSLHREGFENHAPILRRHILQQGLDRIGVVLRRDCHPLGFGQPVRMVRGIQSIA